MALPILEPGSTTMPSKRVPMIPSHGSSSRSERKDHASQASRKNQIVLGLGLELWSLPIHDPRIAQAGRIKRACEGEAATPHDRQAAVLVDLLHGFVVSPALDHAPLDDPFQLHRPIHILPVGRMVGTPPARETYYLNELGPRGQTCGARRFRLLLLLLPIVIVVVVVVVVVAVFVGRGLLRHFTRVEVEELPRRRLRCERADPLRY
eukprot:scaffold80356_cov60-Phaeocystis_antarctica.AAC.2